MKKKRSTPKKSSRKPIAKSKVSDPAKVYESYYYRELKANRTPLAMKDYLKEKKKGKRKKDGTYLAPTYEERLGYPRKFGQFIVDNKLNKKLLEAEMIKLAARLDSEKLPTGSRWFIKKRLSVLMEYYKK
ncbi:MAG: hypothetical protein SH817_10270 [Leptospira sp.]|nr:hypothetical protein [Leptospira sp.]